MTARAAQLFARLLPRRPVLAPRSSRLLAGPLPRRHRAAAREIAAQLFALVRHPEAFARMATERRAHQVIARHTAASLARMALGIAYVEGSRALVAEIEQLERAGDRAELAAIEDEVQAGVARRRAEDEAAPEVRPDKRTRAYWRAVA